MSSCVLYYFLKTMLGALLIAGILSLIVHLFKSRIRRLGIGGLKEGDLAPDFAALDENNRTRYLKEFEGKKIVLYFYPKAMTPGCVKQACGLRDQYEIYKKHNIVVIGISYDSPEDLLIFKEKYKLPFILLSDSDKSIAKLYGAYQSSINALFPARITFLINENGQIAKIIENVNITTHAKDVLHEFGIEM